MIETLINAYELIVDDLHKVEDNIFVQILLSLFVIVVLINYLNGLYYAQMMETKYRKQRFEDEQKIASIRNTYNKKNLILTEKLDVMSDNIMALHQNYVGLVKFEKKILEYLVNVDNRLEKMGEKKILTSPRFPFSNTILKPVIETDNDTKMDIDTNVSNSKNSNENDETPPKNRKMSRAYSLQSPDEITRKHPLETMTLSVYERQMSQNIDDATIINKHPMITRSITKASEQLLPVPSIQDETILGHRMITRSMTKRKAVSDENAKITAGPIKGAMF